MNKHKRNGIILHEAMEKLHFFYFYKFCFFFFDILSDFPGAFTTLSKVKGKRISAKNFQFHIYFKPH